MRKYLMFLAASLTAATPALANEARVEARGGVYWTPGATEATAGVAGGYDFDLGPGAFAGAEVSGDKILASGTKVALGLTGRLGARLPSGDKLFAAAGYTSKPCDLCEHSTHLGAGWEHSFASRLYGKVEYRHFFTAHGAPDSNAVSAGLGVKF
ncbi:MAG: outer membrane beta-barrel protein [Novosphingobium sp.]